MNLKDLKKLKNDELVRGSFILFIMINLFNLFNYGFHLIVARILGPQDYGVFAVLMSFVLIYAIPSEAIQTLISRKVSKLNVKQEYGKMKDLMLDSFKSGAKISIILFVLFSLASVFFFSEILSISPALLIISNLLIFSFFLIPVNRGIMQGRKKFTGLGWNIFLESLFKILFAVILIYFGMKVYGAIIGVVLAVAITLITSFLFIKEIVKSKRENSEVGGLYHQNWNTWIIISAIFIFFSMDIIIAKGIFSPEAAGTYAVMSMIGKMIFYGTSAIAKAMLPISSQKYDEKKDSRSVFKKSLLVTGVICAIALLIMFFFPKLLIAILFGGAYTGSYNSMFNIGISYSLLSISYIFILNGIAHHSFRGYRKFIAFGLIIFFGLILLSYYSSSIFSFSVNLIAVNFAILIAAVIFSRKGRSVEKQ